MKRTLIIIVCAMTMLLLLKCEKSDPTAPTDSTILLSANPDTVQPDATGYGTSSVTAQVLNGSYNPVKGVGVTFSTSPSGTLESKGAARITDSNGRVFDTLRTNAETTVTARSGAASAEISIAVGAGNKPPNVLLEADNNPQKVGRPVIFDGSGSIDTDGSIAGYKWELYPDLDPPEKIPPDPELYDPAIISIVKTYNQAQNVIVKLTVYDNDGAFDQDYIIEEIVSNLPPNAEAGANQSAKLSGTPLAVIVKLDGGQSTDLDGTIQHWSWTCGNGTVSLVQDTQPIGQCRYDMTGTYVATLTVTDNGGAKDSDNATVTISQ